MENNLIKMGIRTFLESLVYKRFGSIKELENYFKVNAREFKVEIVEKDMEEIEEIECDMTNIDFIADWSFIGTMENENILCDFDIYYARTRDNGFIITEVGYEFE